jgi:hypothetical protein
MKLWIRSQQATSLDYDVIYDVGSQDEWYELINQHKPISSILWPTAPLFPILPMTRKHEFTRKHSHEKSYQNNPKRNESYLEASKILAERLRNEIAGNKALVYAPLRGSLPIWKAMSQFLTDLELDVIYPVTSSFVYYPENFGILDRKGRSQSGRYANVLELKRIWPLLSGYKYLVYVDEIVSGSIMRRHLKDMLMLGLEREIPIIAVGMADSFGKRAAVNLQGIEDLRDAGILHAFIWEGCTSLITEDQKFLLGVHYVVNNFGPNAIPVLNERLEFYEEKILFDKDVFISSKKR